MGEAGLALDALGHHAAGELQPSGIGHLVELVFREARKGGLEGLGVVRAVEAAAEGIEALRREFRGFSRRTISCSVSLL
ncbi:MAG: hypothetical protein MZU97_14765 [Bacillus subtilis]|nr:hypothetical protein [Bacillus subtilis]